LFLRRGLFSRHRKALHCNWRAFSIADRLYFFGKFSGLFVARIERKRNAGPPVPAVTALQPSYAPTA
jgi:hypothetical protein